MSAKPRRAYSGIKSRAKRVTTKYRDGEFVRVHGVMVRKLCPREIAEFQRYLARCMGGERFELVAGVRKAVV